MNDNLNESKILIVDDTKVNIDVLGAILSMYKRFVALSGEKAIKIAIEKKPDLILLDIMMPEMDGFEVCKILKETEVTKDIPIIFITAKNQVEDEVRGLELGAVDFITKPISPPVVLARVKNHLELKIAREKLEIKNFELENTLKELKQTQNQLVFAEKMSSLGKLVAGIAHEINTPLGAISSSNQTLLNESKKIITILPEFLESLNKNELIQFNKLLLSILNKDFSLSSREERNIRNNIITVFDANKFENSREITQKLIDIGVYSLDEFDIEFFRNQNILILLNFIQSLSNINSGSNIIKIAIDKVQKLIFALKNYSRHDESSILRTTDINQSIDTVLMIYQNLIKQGITIEKEYNLKEEVLTYPDEINQVWTNIIHNSIQALKNSGTITISTDIKDQYAEIAIWDNGPGIPDNIKQKIFEPFFTTKSEGEGTGLGLSIVKKIIEKHEGMIDVISEVGKGTKFIIHLPRKSQ